MTRLTALVSILLTTLPAATGRAEAQELALPRLVVIIVVDGLGQQELVRYRSHLAQCRELAGGDEPAGRRMDFLCQELNRESNTIASKARDEQVGRLAVEMKAQLEKVREQVQNVE